MKNKTYTTLTIRLETAEYEKLRRIAQEEGRFISRQAAWWVRSGIREFELSKENNSAKQPHPSFGQN